MQELNKIEDGSKRRSKLRKFLQSRERLLLEVGRMVRLGRLLRTRLKEPVSLDSGYVEPFSLFLYYFFTFIPFVLLSSFSIFNLYHMLYSRTT